MWCVEPDFIHHHLIIFWSTCNLFQPSRIVQFNLQFSLIKDGNVKVVFNDAALLMTGNYNWAEKPELE